MLSRSLAQGSKVVARSQAGFASLSSCRITPADVQLRRTANDRIILEKDLGAQKKAFDEARNDLAYCLSFANDDSDFERNFLRIVGNHTVHGLYFDTWLGIESQISQNLQFPSKQMQAQLNISKNQLRTIKKHPVVEEHPLPKTLDEAFFHARYPTVITEARAPFRIVDVNHAWEDLCGFSYVEAKGKTLGELLQGPETDKANATALIYKVMQGEEAGTTLMNYKKNGDLFRNRIRAGPIYDGSDIKYLVGVLQEV